MDAAELQKSSELSQFRAKVVAVDARFRSMLLLDAFSGMGEKFWWDAWRGAIRGEAVGGGYASRILHRDRGD